jgi:LmbE family N-acetylglucosaminyl deacetylase
MVTPGRMVGVFAHPDDEVFCAGGAMAKWAAGGADIVVVCATRGEAGQIRDSTTAVRRTLGQVRGAELRAACDELGVGEVRLLDHFDGTLKDVALDDLASEVEALLIEFAPDTVVTFGEDGAYGHPDHIAIGNATAIAVARLDPRPLLLRSHFPTRTMSLADRLAEWLVAMEDRLAGSTTYGQALTLFAEESTTMRFASDDVRIVWYPPGSTIVEQGEPATSLCLILSGEVEVVQDVGGAQSFLRNLGEGQFFGELGLRFGHPRSASVIATGNVTCLVLSPTKPTKYEGRGDAAQSYGSAEEQSGDALDPSIVTIDVSEFVDRKLAALICHRSQYPIDVDVFPRQMLDDMYGREHFTV